MHSVILTCMAHTSIAWSRKFEIQIIGRKAQIADVRLCKEKSLKSHYVLYSCFTCYFFTLTSCFDSQLRNNDLLKDQISMRSDIDLQPISFPSYILAGRSTIFHLGGYRCIVPLARSCHGISTAKIGGIISCQVMIQPRGRCQGGTKLKAVTSEIGGQQMPMRPFTDWANISSPTLTQTRFLRSREADQLAPSLHIREVACRLVVDPAIIIRRAKELGCFSQVPEQSCLAAANSRNIFCRQSKRGREGWTSG